MFKKEKVFAVKVGKLKDFRNDETDPALEPKKGIGYWEWDKFRTNGKWFKKLGFKK
mgnify:CR=1 FL=1